MSIPKIFCPQCGHLIHDALVCPHCYWQRSYADLALGHLRWETSIEAKIDRASSTRLVVVNASVIVGTRDGTLIALNDVNGEETWRCETFKPLHIQGMRVWEQYVVLTAASDFDAAPWVAVLALVDAMSGAVVWRHEFSATGISCPAVSCGMALFTVAVEGAHAKGFAVDLASRSIRWQVDLERNQRVAPLVADQTVWFGLGTASLNGFLIESLAPAAESSTLYIGEISRFAIAGYPNTLVVVTSDDEAYCMDTSTGQVTERLRTKGKVLHSPAFVNDSLYVILEDSGGACGFYRYKHEYHPPQLWKLFTSAHLLAVRPTWGEATIGFVDSEEIFYLYDTHGQLKFKEDVGMDLCAPMVIHGDTIYLLGRRGKLQSRYWRQPTQLANPPEHYEKHGEWKMAALGYTLRHDWGNGARCFKAAKNWRRARALYRLGEDFYNAGKMSEKVEDLWGALRDYRDAGKSKQVIKILETLKRFREAGEECEKLGDLSRAIEDYRRAGAYSELIRLLKTGEYAHSEEIIDQMSEEEFRAWEYEMHGAYLDAAKAWEVAHRPKLAAKAYWQVGDAKRAFEMLRDCEAWGMLITLYQDYEQGAVKAALGIAELRILYQALEKSRHVPGRAGGLTDDEVVERYIDIAGRIFHLSDKQPSADVEALLAQLHASAAEIYEESLEWEAAEEQRRLFLRFKHWPRLKIQIDEAAKFVVGQLAKLDLAIHNTGYGSATYVDIDFYGAVEGSRKVRGIKMGGVLKIPVQVRVKSKAMDGLENVGQSKLKIQFKYRRPDGSWYKSEMEQFFINVLPDASAEAQPGVKNVTVEEGGTYIEGSRDVMVGKQYLAPVHTGDHVEIKRSVQGGGSLRCPQPDCGFVLDQYAGYTYCPACGTPLRWVD